MNAHLIRLLPHVAVVVIAGACVGGATLDGETATPDRSDTSALAGEAIIVGTDGLEQLPARDGPPEETTNAVPHVQTSAVLVPEVYADLRRRAYSIPGIEERESLLSLPGARSLWLGGDLDLARPEVLQAGREFGHIHPDGSLHLWLPVDRAFEVAENGWGEFHPWVGRDDFWDGLVMVYTPKSAAQADVTIRLIVDAYNYITGAEIDPGTIT
ncbi:MAG: luciferase family protein [Actinomycetota bacterium]